MSNSIEFAEHLFKNSNNAWIQLDIEFDTIHAKSELAKIDKFYVDHRDGENHQGWASCCLHGIDVDKTLGWENYAEQEENINYQWTHLVNYAPTITNFWKNIFPVEGYKRLRFMRLSPGGKINKHRDHDPALVSQYDIFRDGIAVNLAITHPDNCTMTFDDNNIVPWAPGRAIMLNVSRYHEVINNSNLSRVHMIAHAIIGDKKQEFCDLLYRSYKKYHA
jgi:hypothetical protein